MPPFCGRCDAPVVEGVKKCPSCGGRYATMPAGDGLTPAGMGGPSLLALGVAGFLVMGLLALIVLLIAWNERMR